MKMDDVYNKPGYLLRRSHQIAVAIFMEECRAVNITPVQWAALIAIRDFPGIDATRIASLTSFDKSTVGGVLERLEAKGAIKRKYGKKDRRIKLLYITEVGQEMLAQAMPAVNSAQERILSSLTPVDAHKLVELLNQLIEFHNPIPNLHAAGDSISGLGGGVPEAGQQATSIQKWK